MDSALRFAVIFLFGFIVGFLVYDRFFVPEHTIEYRETIVTDSTYKEYADRYRSDSAKWVSKSDSIEFFRKKYQAALRRENIVIVHDSVFLNKPFEAPLRRYSGFKPHLYGNMSYNAVVAGSLLDIEILNDFKIPLVTNTITKTTQTVVKPSGLYGTLGFRAGEQQQLSTLIGATYLKDKSMINYSYDLRFKSHQVGVGFKVLGK